MPSLTETPRGGSHHAHRVPRSHLNQLLATALGKFEVGKVSEGREEVERLYRALQELHDRVVREKAEKSALAHIYGAAR
jgi:hypothetical protein